MPKHPTKKKTTNIAIEPHPNLEEEIRHRAYEFYEKRGHYYATDGQ